MRYVLLVLLIGCAANFDGGEVPPEDIKTDAAPIDAGPLADCPDEDCNEESEAETICENEVIGRTCLCMQHTFDVPTWGWSCPGWLQ